MSECMVGDSQGIIQSYEIEKEVLKQILVLEKELQDHYALMKNEMVLQNGLVERLWILSQRYIIIDSGGPSSRCPDANTGLAEDALLLEFSDKLTQIRNSNCRIRTSLSGVRNSYLVFESLCAELDTKTGSSLIIDGIFHKPISYFIELISDIIKFFHSWILKLVFSSNQFDPIKSYTVEQYKSHTEISTNFEEYFQLGLTYCKCLRFKTNSSKLSISKS